MNNKFFRIVLICLFAGLFSCQDRENSRQEDVDIIPPENKKEELKGNDNPMERSRVLARMREDDELSSFTEELSKSGLQEEFEGREGIYTFFAPSNAAYDRIPAKELNADGSPGTEESKGDNLLYYMVEGDMTLGYLREKIRASEDGRYEFRTALGEKLWATEEGDRIVLIDVLGNKARIMTSELNDYYGAYHIIDNVLQPGENRDGATEDES